MWKSKAVCASFLFLSFLFLFALFGPSLRPFGFAETHLELKNLPPSWVFWFGTDELGRDLFVRVCYGARISLFVGVVAALIDLFIGVVYGAIAAFFGRLVDEMMTRFADLLSSIPNLLLSILLSVLTGPNLVSLLLSLTLTGWMQMARIVRAKALQVKQSAFVEASLAMGASPLFVVKRHLIPNAMGPILATATLTIPSAMFGEAFLSFLGLGVPPPMASWGTMIADGLNALHYFPWRIFFPSLFMTGTILSLNLIGIALRDHLDPRRSS